MAAVVLALSVIGRATIGPPYVILRALDVFLGDAAL
jgi:hypothetical protein